MKSPSQKSSVKPSSLRSPAIVLPALLLLQDWTAKLPTVLLEKRGNASGPRAGMEILRPLLLVNRLSASAVLVAVAMTKRARISWSALLYDIEQTLFSRAIYSYHESTHDMRRW